MKRTILLLYTFLLCLPVWAQDDNPVEVPKGSAAATSVNTRPNPATEKSIMVFPNPSNGVVQITLSGFKKQRSELRIMNVIGNVVHRELLTDLQDRDTRTIDLSKFTSGLYYIKLQTDDYSAIRKVIIN